MLKVLLLDEDASRRAEAAMGLMQAGYMAAVAPTAAAAHDKLLQLEFDWLVCRRLRPGAEVDAFLEVLCAEGIHGDVLKLLLLTDDDPPEDLDTWPFAGVHLGGEDLAPEGIVALLKDPRRTPSAGGAATLPAPTFAGPLMIGSSPAIQRAAGLLARVARTDSTVLITGESGTGKELAAQTIHQLSGRAEAPIVPLNCGAIPGELLESELFGHAKGAFTGAATQRKGRVALAEGGTLFLDEIGEMPVLLQPKLLRVLQESEYTPLGAERTVKADVRVVAATNQNLEALVAAKQFREDLFYRLNVIPIHLPPLRERREDVPELVSFFLSHFGERFGAPAKGISEEALGALCAWDWPGNIRELKNIVERLVILSEGEVIGVDDLPEKLRAAAPPPATGPLPGTEGYVLPEEGLAFYDAVEQFERSLILQALDRTAWNKNQAAALLKMKRTTLVEKLKKRDITRG